MEKNQNETQKDTVVVVVNSSRGDESPLRPSSVLASWYNTNRQDKTEAHTSLRQLILEYHQTEKG